MIQYIDNIIYTSSKNNKQIKYNCKDQLLRNTLNIEEDTLIGAADAFYDKAKHGFGSEYSINTITFESAAVAIKESLPHWKICN